MLEGCTDLIKHTSKYNKQYTFINHRRCPYFIFIANLALDLLFIKQLSNFYYSVTIAQR